MGNQNINTCPTGANQSVAPKDKILNRKKKKLIFYICMIVYPVLQFSIFYIYTHLNSVILAFKDYSLDENSVTVTAFAGFKNFGIAFDILKNNLHMVKNSLILYAFNLGIGFTFAVVFSFYIYKKFPGSKIFQIILFMPNLISGIVFALIFKYMVTDVYKQIFDAQLGLLDNPDTQFGTVLFFNIWMSFGVNVIMFSGAMSGIDESLVEASKLDGANIVQEFIHLAIPMVYKTLVSFIIVGMVGIFTNQMRMFSLLGSSTQNYSIGTLGYYLYIEAQNSDIIVAPGSIFQPYQVLSAIGVILTIILIPFVIGSRKLLEKYGPSAE